MRDPHQTKVRIAMAKTITYNFLASVDRVDLCELGSLDVDLEG